MPYRVADAACVEKFREELNDLERLSRDARWRRWRVGMVLGGIVSLASASVAALDARPAPPSPICKRPVGSFVHDGQASEAPKLCWTPPPR